MEYIISDKDIDTILVQGWDFRRLIKSKQPVELVIKFTKQINMDLQKIIWQRINDMTFTSNGEEIKIYIQKVKEEIHVCPVCEGAGCKTCNGKGIISKK